MTLHEPKSLSDIPEGAPPGQVLAMRLARGERLRVAIATDGSPSARTAASVAGDLARRLNAEVVVLAAFRDAEEALRNRHVLDQARDLLSDLDQPPEGVELIGYADESIIEYLAADPVDLLVVGAFGDRGVTRFVIGSTAQRLVLHAAPSVLVVKGLSPNYRKILACTAVGDEVVVDVAAQLKRRLPADLHLLHVVPPTAAMYMALPDIVAVPLDEVLSQDTPRARHLSACLATLESVDLDADVVSVRRGAVPDAIFQEARAGEYDLIVVGSQAGPVRESYFIGSIADRVVKHAHRSVLVVRTTSQ